jgi:hypothetical protein
MEKRPHRVDEPWMLAREELERDQRRATAGRALVVEAAPQELRLLTEPELPDRAVRDSTLAVVGRPRLTFDLVLPPGSQLGQLALGALLRERGRFSRG